MIKAGVFLLIYSLVFTGAAVVLGWTAPYVYWIAGLMFGEGVMALAAGLARRLIR